MRFGGLLIEHDDTVLEPRGWTVEQSAWAAELHPGLPPGPILELCSGAGHIGLVAALRSGRELLQVDVSDDACGFARRNADAAGLGERVTVLQAPLRSLRDSADRFPLILADPPYLPSDEIGRFPEDPTLAIDGGTDGLHVLRDCVEVIDALLHPEGAALVQVRGAEQAARVAATLPDSLVSSAVREHDPERAVILLTRPRRLGRPLHELLMAAMDRDDDSAWATVTPEAAQDEHDELVTLLAIHDLWMAPVFTLGGKERFQLHPQVVAVKRSLEQRYLARLDDGARLLDQTMPVGDGLGDATGGEDDSEVAVAAMRRIAKADLVPSVYTWLAEEATWDQIVRFLALEGGPDAGFDDLVATAQVGIHGEAKVTLGANYWDEMGRGELADVHTVLHDQLVEATSMPRIPRADMPTEALHRIALGGVLATNRALQPELLGALGLIEMQAGPRCRAVIAALQRVGAPAGALPFYEEHAVADPRHGKEWLDHVVAPLAREHAGWGERMVQGALWRHQANDRFFSVARRVVEGGGEPQR